MSTGRSSCGSLASSAQDNQADSDRECPAGWPQGSAGQASSGCWGRQPRDKPCCQSLTCPQSLVKCIVVKGRRLQWLHACTGSHDRLAKGGGSISGKAVRPALAAGGRPAAGTAGTPAGQQRPRAGQRRLVVRRASGGQPVGPRRLAVPGSGRQSRTAIRRQRTRRDRGTDRWTAVLP